MVMVNYQHNELILEFTGKILLDNYTSLICTGTAMDCLSQINRLGICHLDVDSIMEDCNVVKCDVTKDIECNQMQDIITNVRQNLSNYKKCNKAISERRNNDRKRGENSKIQETPNHLRQGKGTTIGR